MSALPPISSLPSTTTTGSLSSVSTPKSIDSSGDHDRNLFVDLMARANDDQLRSDQAVENLVSGENQDVQQVVMEVVKAEMSFQIFMEVRNKIVDSYNELMRMQF